MTTVKELIHQLTAEYVDLDAPVELHVGWTIATDFEVTAVAGVLRIESDE